MKTISFRRWSLRATAGCEVRDAWSFPEDSPPRPLEAAPGSYFFGSWFYESRDYTIVAFQTVSVNGCGGVRNGNVRDALDALDGVR